MSSTPEEVKAAIEQPGAKILDVRTADELKEAQLESQPFHHASCHLDDCSDLMSKADELFPDKNGMCYIWCCGCIFI